MVHAVVLIVLSIGGLMVFGGFLLQNRALARYGKTSRPRMVGYWNCAEYFDSKDGMRLFLQGDALLSWGAMLVIGASGYLAGRG